MDRRHNRHFPEEDIQMADKYMKRCCSILLLSRKIQNKASMRYHYTFIKIKINDHTICWQRCRETESLTHCWWEHKME